MKKGKVATIPPLTITHIRDNGSVINTVPKYRVGQQVWVRASSTHDHKEILCPTCGQLSDYIFQKGGAEAKTVRYIEFRVTKTGAQVFYHFEEGDYDPGWGENRVFGTNAAAMKVEQEACDRANVREAAVMNRMKAKFRAARAARRKA
jgi:hypothetical protein